jgi:hypothetical protein
MRRQRTRASTFIDGVGADAAVAADHIAARAGSVAAWEDGDARSV